MITSGVATPITASNNIAVVRTMAAINPASSPQKVAFVLLIRNEYELYSRLCQAPDDLLRGVPAANAAATIHFAIATIFRTRSTTIAGVTCFMQA